MTTPLKPPKEFHKTLKIMQTYYVVVQIVILSFFLAVIPHSKLGFCSIYTPTTIYNRTSSETSNIIS